VILDEADEMLSMGFRDDLETILNYTSGKSQAVMFSATLSKEIKAMMKRWFSDPEMIEVAGTATTAEGIEHRVVEVRDSMRTEAICRFLDKGEYRLALIFCNTKRKCDSLAEEMQSRGYSSDVLHGDMNQDQRDRVMRKFRSGRVEVLIATDVAARGLDVEDVDVVFNYDIPQDPEYYVHRVGRTGRAGRKGEAYTFWAGRKRRNITAIEKALKMKLDVATMPTLQDVEDSRADTYLERVVSTLEAGGLRPWIERVERAVAGKFTHVEVAAALLKMQSDSTSQNFKDTNGEKRERPDNDDSRSSRGARQGGGGGRGHKSGRSTNSRAEKRGGKKKKEAFYKHFEEKKSNKRSRKGR
ncbi:MAG: DEAD/DEAH box helicase, partial [Balneolaceae bacterium]